MIPERHLAKLQVRCPGATATRNPDGSHTVTIPGVVLPPGWNRQSVTVAFVAPVGYPLAAPDCFWTEPGLALVHGGAPQNTGYNQGTGVPAGWLWFSWHPAQWDANRDDFETFLQVIRRRFHEAR